MAKQPGSPMARALRRFHVLYRKAQRAVKIEPTSMTLATSSKQGRPSARTVLLKSADPRGFVFFTNSRSRKGRDLESNPQAALCFFWPALAKQVLVEGRTTRVSAAEADAYWRTRPRDSQLGAWASEQSQPLKNRAALLQRQAFFRRKFAGRPVPRPAHWNGYRLTPRRLEFWSRGAYRLHRREVIEQTPRGWKTFLANP